MGAPVVIGVPEPREVMLDLDPADTVPAASAKGGISQLGGGVANYS